MWHPEPERLALAALPADAAVITHLAACLLCREHVDVLRRTVMDGEDGSDTDSTPAPPDRVWQAILDELGAETRPVRKRPTARRARWRSLVVPAAAAVVGASAGLGVGAAFSPPPTGRPIALLAPLGGADPAATGTVEALDRDGGHELLVRLDGVTGLAGADHLEAWLMDAGGSRMLALGSLAQDGGTFRGTFTVPADLPMAEFDTVDVSVETWDGNPAHSRVSVLRGPLR